MTILKFFRKKKEQSPEAPENPVSEEVPVQDNESPSEPNGWFARLKNSLARTRDNFSNRLANLFLGKKEIDEDLLEEIENLLLTADMGAATTATILEQLTQGISRKEIKDPAMVYAALQQSLIQILKSCEENFAITAKPMVILMVGVNGAGKTTTIGKLAKYFQQQGQSILLAAGDTFRAAAVEQLKVWGERNDVPVISQQGNADSASVIFDAFQSAKAKGIDILIADTAGRLHAKTHLMDELKKIKKVLQKLDANAPHEVMLVLDASMGQNALTQAHVFHEALNVNGITLTKLDGTAKGGIIFAIANQLKIPIRFIGVGEKIEDLRPFDATNFVHALFDLS
jgi:fused signal recognition particle receptor